jgi:hypothetical protein
MADEPAANDPDGVYDAQGAFVSAFAASPDFADGCTVCGVGPGEPCLPEDPE